MLNLQIAEKPIRRGQKDGALDVHSIFPTIQGEGPFAGSPAVFVRLAGCDLQCPSCDTEYTKGRQLRSVVNLRLAVISMIPETFQGSGDWRKRPLVVLTGGEPFRQECGIFIKAMSQAGCHVQVETNGTLFDNSCSELGMFHHFSVVCSPKTKNIHPKMEGIIDHLKYIVQAGKVDEVDGLPTESLNYGMRPARPWKNFSGTIYLQPMDEQDEVLNKANLKAAMDSCLKHGYTLCLQLHKLLGLD